jgi:hypothetical protein
MDVFRQVVVRVVAPPGYQATSVVPWMGVLV